MRVVPVEVADEDRSVERSPLEERRQPAKSGSAVEHQVRVVVIVRDGDARRLPPVTDERRAR